MATHPKLSLSVRAIVALVALTFGACSSNGSKEDDSGDGSEGHLDGAKAGSAASGGGASEASGGATDLPDEPEGSGATGAVGMKPSDHGHEDPDEGQGGSPTEPAPAAAGAGGEASGPSQPPAPSEAFLRGEALVTESQCVTCHQRNFAGFTVFPNITPDVETGIGEWSDAQIIKAIRAGVGRDGASLCVTMQRYPFSDEQAADVVAFLRGVSPVSNRITSVCPGHSD
jgi:hypothetical protein